MRTILVLLLSLTACTEEKMYVCEYYAAGMCVADETHSIDPAQVERVVEIVESVVSQRFDWVTNLPYALEGENTRLIFTDEPYAQNCLEIEDGMYRCEKWVSGYNAWDGETAEIRAFVPAPGSCTALSTLGHEILHSIERMYMLPRENAQSHDYPYFFYSSYGRESFEWQIDTKIIKLCKSGGWVL